MLCCNTPNSPWREKRRVNGREKRRDKFDRMTGGSWLVSLFSRLRCDSVFLSTTPWVEWAMYSGSAPLDVTRVISETSLFRQSVTVLLKNLSEVEELTASWIFTSCYFDSRVLFNFYTITKGHKTVVVVLHHNNNTVVVLDEIMLLCATVFIMYFKRTSLICITYLIYVFSIQISLPVYRCNSFWLTSFLFLFCWFVCWNQALSYWTLFACQSLLAAKPPKTKPLLLNCRHCDLH